ncbi:hypothetical protein NA56DRAFT_712178 [Hyaloscypha hepaticicola]|uniref:Uncharacterized protein n=1 Tax=Hyaloscypha hepaticicola TaxID=2082293 RepID=A0A2J6PH09_9HELO|nr:hypothetical protein NA56DRAFT_712178 [Hyaloscypha hepaticicola]
MTYWDTEMGMSIDALLPFCALSSVRKARIHRCSEEFFFPSSQRYPNIQDLQISYSNIGSEALTNILQCFPSLKNLYYEDVGDLGRAISHLHKTLEGLIVLGSGNNVFGEEEERTIGSLAGFKKLKTIVMNHHFLLIPGSEIDGEKPKLINILPSSLEMLAMADCTLDILPQVRDLLDQKPSSSHSFPKPNKIVIGLGSEDDPLASPDDSSVSAEQLEAMKDEAQELIADVKPMGVDIGIFYRNFRMGESDWDHKRYPL